MDTDTPSVLIVEAEPDLAELYASWLEDAYRVETARDESAVRAVVDGEFDVVVVDRRRLPNGPTDELRDAISADEFDSKVVAVTGTEPAVDSDDAAFDDYLLKPVSRGDLRRSVENLLLRRTYDEQLGAYFELVSKKATLDGRLSEAELQSSQEYAELEDRIAVLRTRVNETRSQLLERDHNRRLYRDVSSAPD
ncbi:HalX domain-containing protein [Natronococcus sp. A-GB7]|uniref:response regulator transcription factor n=1 Tax=Natronococcus sp. A-GB7 TaxID=3037649 RepID=UPI002420238C|nr:HalX domain-containing protein [Natronococcus sp. A-GB7]MDG5818894.1 HalX domain-containing protein [Natronococcus sp. A-GB7]